MYYNCHDFYIFNNHLYSQRNEDFDEYDGLIDIKRGSYNITIDRNYLHDHHKALLMGHTDDYLNDEQMTITLCNNRFENITTRCPSIRFGKLHVFNNTYKNIRDYAIAARCGAKVIIEKNIFEKVGYPITTKFPGKSPFIYLNENRYNVYDFDTVHDKGYREQYYMLMTIKYRKKFMEIPYDY